MTQRISPAEANSPFKQDSKHAEEQTLSVDDESILSGKDPRIKRIKRLTDMRICALLGLLYMMAAIDRVNLGVCCLKLLAIMSLIFI